jgi:cytochrome P450
MPLMEACIHETLRMATIGVLSIMHSTSEEIPDFHGYTLPKDTIVYGNFWQVNHDKEIWGDPENFRPERFLGDGASKVSLINVFSRGNSSNPISQNYHIE